MITLLSLLTVLAAARLFKIQIQGKDLSAEAYWLPVFICVLMLIIMMISATVLPGLLLWSVGATLGFMSDKLAQAYWGTPKAS